MAVLLTIPCFNEAERLPAFLPGLLQEIAAAALPVSVEIVDDGSSPDERQAISQLVAALRPRHPFLLPPRELPANHGKGAAIRASWDAAPATADWLAFVDADGSISPAETCRFLRHCLAGEPPCTWLASRIRMLGRCVRRSAHRHLMRRVFATLVGTLINPGVYDTQCGLKALPACHYRQIRPLLAENRFAFDVELIAALDHARLPAAELPIDWHETPGSKVRLVRDTLAMLRAVLRIRRRLKRGWD